jgi:hypothetical protein
MIGGDGDDTFIVSEAADFIAEGVGQGTFDWVRMTAGYGLGASVEVERLSTFDTAQHLNFNIFGNELSRESGATRARTGLTAWAEVAHAKDPPGPRRS